MLPPFFRINESTINLNAEEKLQKKTLFSSPHNGNQCKVEYPVVATDTETPEKRMKMDSCFDNFKTVSLTTSAQKAHLNSDYSASQHSFRSQYDFGHFF